jgi:hypothetical protein
LQPTGATPRILAALGSLAVIGLSGCATKSAPSPVAAVLNQPAATAATAPASDASATSTATSSSSGAVQNLDVSSAVRSQLTAAYAAVQQIPAADVAGTRPGDLYYAYVPATQTYWAWANFEVSQSAPSAVGVKFQDGASVGWFKKAGSSPWQAVLGGNDLCDVTRFFPQAVVSAWSLMSLPHAPC